MTRIRTFSPYLLGYLILVVFIAVGFHLIRQEARARQAFDDRRQYEICVGGNERIDDINDRFDRLDKTLVSFGDPDDPRVKEFLEREQAAALSPRKCQHSPDIHGPTEGTSPLTGAFGILAVMVAILTPIGVAVTGWFVRRVERKIEDVHAIATQVDVAVNGKVPGEPSISQDVMAIRKTQEGEDEEALRPMVSRLTALVERLLDDKGG